MHLTNNKNADIDNSNNTIKIYQNNDWHIVDSMPDDCYVWMNKGGVSYCREKAEYDGNGNIIPQYLWGKEITNNENEKYYFKASRSVIENFIVEFLQSQENSTENYPRYVDIYINDTDSDPSSVKLNFEINLKSNFYNSFSLKNADLNGDSFYTTDYSGRNILQIPGIKTGKLLLTNDEKEELYQKIINDYKHLFQKYGFKINTNTDYNNNINNIIFPRHTKSYTVDGNVIDIKPSLKYKKEIHINKFLNKKWKNSQLNWYSRDFENGILIDETNEGY